MGWSDVYLKWSKKQRKYSKSSFVLEGTPSVELHPEAQIPAYSWNSTNKFRRCRLTLSCNGVLRRASSKTCRSYCLNPPPYSHWAAKSKSWNPRSATAQPSSTCSSATEGGCNQKPTASNSKATAVSSKKNTSKPRNSSLSASCSRAFLATLSSPDCWRWRPRCCWST